MPGQVMLFRCCKGLDEEKLVVTQTEQDGVVIVFLVRVKRVDISDSGLHTDLVCNLGVVLDSWFLLEQQVAAMAREALHKFIL